MITLVVKMERLRNAPLQPGIHKSLSFWHSCLTELTALRHADVTHILLPPPHHMQGFPPPLPPNQLLEKLRSSAVAPPSPPGISPSLYNGFAAQHDGAAPTPAPPFLNKPNSPEGEDADTSKSSLAYIPQNAPTGLFKLYLGDILRFLNFISISL